MGTNFTLLSKEGLTIGHRALVKPEIPRVDRSPVLTPRIGDTLARGANLALAVHLDRLIKREGRRGGGSGTLVMTLKPLSLRSLESPALGMRALLQLQSAANEDRQ